MIVNEFYNDRMHNLHEGMTVEQFAKEIADYDGGDEELYRDINVSVDLKKIFTTYIT